MVTLWNRADHYIFILSFALSFYLFFSSPNLSHHRLDVCHTSTHGAALVQISDAGLKHAARGSLIIQDTRKLPKITIWAPSHNFVGLYLHNYGMYRQSEKKNLLSSNMSSRCPHDMVNFGPLPAEIGPVVCGTPMNFNGFCVLAPLLHGSQVVSISQLCGIEQSVPPMFGRATITLGIGSHSSSFCILICCVTLLYKYYIIKTRERGPKPMPH